MPYTKTSFQRVDPKLLKEAQRLLTTGEKIIYVIQTLKVSPAWVNMVHKELKGRGVYFAPCKCGKNSQHAGHCVGYNAKGKPKQDFTSSNVKYVRKPRPSISKPKFDPKPQPEVQPEVRTQPPAKVAAARTEPWEPIKPLTKAQLMGRK